MQVKHGRLPQAGAVTSFMFGMVQRLIGLGEQFAWLFVNHWIHYGDADTQGQTPQRAAWVLDIQAGYRCMDACGDLLGALLMGVGEDDGELLAAVTAGGAPSRCRLSRRAALTLRRASSPARWLRASL